MNAHFSRSIVLAVALVIGASSVSTAFAAIRNNGPSGPSSSTSSGPGPSTGTPGSGAVVTDAVICNADIRCIVPPKKPVVKLIKWHCPTGIRYGDYDDQYKGCRREPIYGAF